MSGYEGWREEMRTRREGWRGTSWCGVAPAVLLLCTLAVAVAGCGDDEGDWVVTGLRLVEVSEESAVVSVRLGRTVVTGSHEVPGETEYVCSGSFGDCDTEERQGPSTWEDEHGLREQFGLVLDIDPWRGRARVVETLEPRSGEARNIAGQAREEAEACCAAGLPVAVVVSGDGEGIELRRCSGEVDPALRRLLSDPLIVLDGETLRSRYAATLAW